MVGEVASMDSLAMPVCSHSVHVQFSDKQRQTGMRVLGEAFRSSRCHSSLQLLLSAAQVDTGCCSLSAMSSTAGAAVKPCK